MELAAAVARATILGARVFVVAVERHAFAKAIAAQVALGAGGAVVARAGLGRVLALAGDAIVVCALEVILAHATGRFVGLAIAVVVEQIAGLGLRLGCVAGAQPAAAASPLAATCSCRSAQAAAGGEAQFQGARVASADQVFLEAQVDLDAAKAGCRLAIIAYGTIGGAGACGRAKVAQ